MKKKHLLANKSNTEYVESLPKIYLVVRGSEAEIFELPFTGKFKYDIDMKADIPIVYQYDEKIAYDFVYVMRKITYVTSKEIIGWTTDKNEAESWKNEGE